MRVTSAQVTYTVRAIAFVFFVCHAIEKDSSTGLWLTALFRRRFEFNKLNGIKAH